MRASEEMEREAVGTSIALSLYEMMVLFYDYLISPIR